MSSLSPTAEDLPLEQVVTGLRLARREWRERHRLREPRGRELPSAELLQGIVGGLRGALFPLRLGPPDLRPEAEDFYIGHQLDTQLQALRQQVLLELRYAARGQQAEAVLAARSQALVAEFALALPLIRRLLDSDVLAAFEGDPAARSVDEVLLCYPGIEAMIHHRLAHQLYLLGVPLLARIVAELAHAKTGIDIHPGAQIGPGLFIDHGTGVVIGETAVIGERVRIYQAVTLGAKRFPADEEGNLQKGQPRHPIVEDDVVIYAGATILGRITIGKGSTIGGNVWLTRSVPENSNITQANLQNESGV
ncbi:MAG TPA: serine O-acetyltransferase EpsC [Roseateles sp.]|nr:serine O-acetyltransferase EpsC [Roseateles sp.]